MRDQVCRQVQTEMRKTCEKEAPSFARSEQGPESEAWGEQEDARRERRTEPARLHPQRAPGQQEADPDHAREEPSRTPDAPWRGLQGEWAVPDMVTGKTQGHARKNGHNTWISSCA